MISCSSCQTDYEMRRSLIVSQTGQPADLTDSSSAQEAAAGEIRAAVATVAGVGEDRTWVKQDSAGSWLRIAGMIIGGCGTAGFGGGLTTLGGVAVLEGTTFQFMAAEFGAGLVAWQARIHMLGSVITGTVADAHAGIHIESGSALFLTDSVITHGTSGSNAGCICIQQSQAIVLSSVAQHCSAVVEGGAVYIVDGSYLQFLGDNVVAFSNAHRGGGLCGLVSVVLLHDQTRIRNNTAAVGGGMQLQGGNALLDGDACVSHNQARKAGGGVFKQDGVFIMADRSELIFNNATLTGGGLHVESIVERASIILLDHASVSDNVVSGKGGHGGGITMFWSDLALHNSSMVHRNMVAVSGRGAGVYGLDGSLVVMTGSSSLRNNSCVGDGGWGGGLYSEATNVELMGAAAVVGNDAAYGGGLAVESAILSLQDAAEVSNNIARRAGGGVYVQGVKVVFGGHSLVTRNVAERADGGGLLAYASMLSLSENTAVVQNEAVASHAGGIGLFDNSDMVLSGRARVSGNRASGPGMGGGGLLCAQVRQKWRLMQHQQVEVCLSSRKVKWSCLGNVK